LVSHRGRLIAERYYDSHVDDHAEVRSVTESVMATLVGAALREGRLPSLDATLGELRPHYRSIMDARTERITVRQLLTQTAGYTDKQVNDIDPDRPAVPQLLKPGPQNPPGAGFEYQDGGPHLLSAVIAEVTGQTTLDYARRVLFEPLDIQTRPAYQGSLFDINKPEVEVVVFNGKRLFDGVFDRGSDGQCAIWVGTGSSSTQRQPRCSTRASGCALSKVTSSNRPVRSGEGIWRQGSSSDVTRRPC
jgi:CubicO group peptidase (beta-lactamase class C family)